MPFSLITADIMKRAIFARRGMHNALEGGIKGLAVTKAAGCGNIDHGPIGRGKETAGLLNTQLLQKSVHRQAGCLTEDTVQVILTEKDMRRKLIERNVCMKALTQIGKRGRDRILLPW